jgi:hypothetical protein
MPDDLGRDGLGLRSAIQDRLGAEVAYSGVKSRRRLELVGTISLMTCFASIHSKARSTRRQSEQAIRSV